MYLTELLKPHNPASELRTKPAFVMGGYKVTPDPERAFRKTKWERNIMQLLPLLLINS